MTAPDLQAFHICLVVRELEPAMETYRKILGVDNWRLREMGTANRIAYGRGSGQTLELVQPLPTGSGQFHDFLARYGEGVQHLGFWTPDIRSSVSAALESGASLVSAQTDASGHTAVQLLPASANPDLSGLRMAAWVDVGVGGCRIEYIGTEAGEAFFTEWLGTEYRNIVTPPPW